MTAKTTGRHAKKTRTSDAKEREHFYQKQIEAIQRLLEAPKPHMTTFTDQERYNQVWPKQIPNRTQQNRKMTD